MRESEICAVALWWCLEEEEEKELEEEEEKRNLFILPPTLPSPSSIATASRERLWEAHQKQSREAQQR